MAIQPRQELPGDVIAALRQAHGFTRSVDAFASSLYLSHDTVRRLERVRWGTTREKWPRPVDRRDLDTFVQAGYITEGDDWWMRFMTAFAWQHLVMEYGKEVFDEGEPRERLLAPVREAHVIALVREVCEREIARRTRGGRVLTPTEQEVLTERVCAEVLFRLATTGLTRELGDDDDAEGRIVPELEPTRGAEGGPVGGPEAQPAHLRTLRLAHDWAVEAVGEEFRGEERASSEDA